MFIPKTRIICKVTDSNGVDDIIEVNSEDEIPTKWVSYRVLRIESV